MKKLQLITPIASIVAIICFFAPWVSCFHERRNGFELATRHMSTDVLLLVIPAAALFILVVFIVFYIRRKLETAILPTIAASVLSLFIMGLMFIDVQRLKSQISGPTDKMSENIDEIFKEDSGRSKIRESTEKLNQLYDDTIKIEWGYWVSALALATCVFGSWQYKNEPPEGGMPKETAPPYKEGSTELS